MRVDDKRLGEIKADYWLWKGSCGDAMHRKARKLIEIDMLDLIADRAEMRADLADVRKQYDEARVLLSTRWKLSGWMKRTPNWLCTGRRCRTRLMAWWDLANTGLNCG